MFFKLLKEAWKKAKEENEKEKMKKRFLSQSIDYAYLEELIQKVNENPKLKVAITLLDGTRIDLNCTPKIKNPYVMEELTGVMEVR